ncbi:MAG: MerR family DNA-binding transcriptional regulator [Candidatus Paceibacterota bacterium]
MDKQYINIKEAAEMLGVSRLTLRNWDRDGKLSALRHPISNYRVYKTEEIKKILEKIESGEKPIRTPKIKKPKFFKVNVVHLKD